MAVCPLCDPCRTLHRFGLQYQCVRGDRAVLGESVDAEQTGYLDHWTVVFDRGARRRHQRRLFSGRVAVDAEHAQLRTGPDRRRGHPGQLRISFSGVGRPELGLIPFPVVAGRPALQCPHGRARRFLGETLGYTSAPLGTPLTITAQINGAWSNPDDPYRPQPDIYDELNNITPVKMDMTDTGSTTATAPIATPDGSAVQVPAFLNQKLRRGFQRCRLDRCAGLDVPLYTAHGRHLLGIRERHDVRRQHRVNRATVAAPLSFTVESTKAAHYQGFVQIDKSSGDQTRYYQYSRDSGTATSPPDPTSRSTSSRVPPTSMPRSALFGGSPGTVETINGQPVIVGAQPGNGETSSTLATYTSSTSPT